MHIALRSDTPAQKCQRLLRSLPGLIGEGLPLYEASLQRLEEVVTFTNAHKIQKNKQTNTNHMKNEGNMYQSLE